MNWGAGAGADGSVESVGMSGGGVRVVGSVEARVYSALN